MKLFNLRDFIDRAKVHKDSSATVYNAVCTFWYRRLLSSAELTIGNVTIEL